LYHGGACSAPALGSHVLGTDSICEWCDPEHCREGGGGSDEAEGGSWDLLRKCICCSLPFILDSTSHKEKSRLILLIHCVVNRDLTDYLSNRMGRYRDVQGCCCDQCLKKFGHKLQSFEGSIRGVRGPSDSSDVV